MEKIKPSPLFIIGLILVMLTAACAQQEPIQIIITPTPDPNVVTAQPTETPTLPSTHTPTQTATSTATMTPTSTPTVTTAAQSQSEGSGPRVGTEYVRPSLEPTPTVLLDIPTVTNTPGAPTQSFTPESRESPSPTATFTAAIPAGTALPRLDPNRMGLQLYSQVSFDDFTPVIGAAETTGVGWVKIQANWAFLQPDGPNDWNAQMQLFERQVELAARPGFNVLLSVAKAPLWARSNGEEDGPPDDPQTLADFITFMLGTKIGESIAAIEVWNEPNLIREWRGILPFDGGGYMQLFVPAYDAIRAYSPTMMVVTAGLAPTGALEDTVDDRTFLRQMYENGLGDYRDIVIGVHPYGWGNPPDTRCCNQIPDRGWDDDPHFFFIETLDEYYAIMTEFGHGDLQMWLTEFGWATWDGLPGEAPEPWMTYTTLETQIQHTVRAFEIGQSLPYVGPMFLWNLNFANQALIDNRDERAAYSLIIPILPVSERPLYWALAQMTGSLD